MKLFALQQEKKQQELQDIKFRQAEQDNIHWNNVKRAVEHLIAPFLKLAGNVNKSKILSLPYTKKVEFFDQLHSIYLHQDSEMNSDFIQRLLEIMQKNNIKEKISDFVALRDLYLCKLNDMKEALQTASLHGDKINSLPDVEQSLQRIVADKVLNQLSLSDNVINQQLCQIKELLNRSRPPAVKPPATTAPSISEADQQALSACIIDARKRIQWLSDLRNLTQSVPLSEEINTQLEVTIQALRLPQLSGDIAALDKALSLGEQLLQRAGANPTEPKVLLKLLLALLQAGLVDSAAVAEQEKEEDWLLLSAAGCGLLQLPSLSAATRSQALQLLRASLDSASSLCYPDLTGAASNSSKEVTLRFLGLLAAISGRWEVDGRPDPTWAWSWLVAAGEQMCQLQAKKRVDGSRWQFACRCVRLVLRLAGHNLFLRFQDEFRRLLQAIQTLIQATDSQSDSEQAKLQLVLSDGLERGWIPARFHLQLAPYACDALRVVR